MKGEKGDEEVKLRTEREKKNYKKGKLQTHQKPRGFLAPERGAARGAQPASPGGTGFLQPPEGTGSSPGWAAFTSRSYVVSVLNGSMIFF